MVGQGIQLPGLCLDGASLSNVKVSMLRYHSWSRPSYLSQLGRKKGSLKVLSESFLLSSLKSVSHKTQFFGGVAKLWSCSEAFSHNDTSNIPLAKVKHRAYSQTEVLGKYIPVFYFQKLPSHMTKNLDTGVDNVLDKY